MKIYFIKIDRKSIKENENAGQTQTILQGRKTISFKINYLPDYFKDGVNCFITSWEEINGIKTKFRGEIIRDELLNRCFEEKLDINISVHVEPIFINHFPIPKYSFSYENTKVKCRRCKSKIMSNDLVSDVDTFDENYSTTICPICGKFYSCKLEYEKIEDIML